MEIEKGIPLVAKKDATKYPFSKMEVGDSLMFEGETSQGRGSMAAHEWGRKNGRKFAARKVEGGCRVWRIE